MIPMSNNNKNKFMKLLSSHIININRAFKNIKSNIMADFVRSDQASIIIITNQVVSSLNLQIIKKYIENTTNIILEEIDTSCLP